jgi:hypothetical protein
MNFYLIYLFANIHSPLQYVRTNQKCFVLFSIMDFHDEMLFLFQHIVLTMFSLKIPNGFRLGS